LHILSGLEGNSMRFAFVIFDGMTALDFIGVYDPLTRLKTMGFLPDLGWDLCAPSAEVVDGTGLKFQATVIAKPLEGYDLVFVPGGWSTRELVHHPDFIAWIATAGRSSLIASVCTGALLLGAAGLLKGKAATTHPRAFDLLKPSCAEVINRRVADSGDVITARGVTSSIDLGLYLCEKFSNANVRIKIQDQMDYNAYPFA
jgi:transcriptional regulator GlxA family with amidase domain